jgi:ribonuclease HI
VPAGAGASVVQATDRGKAVVAWSAAMILAAASANSNLAEYFGLLTGLRAAHPHGWTPLDVLGDSLLVLGQMS